MQITAEQILWLMLATAGVSGLLIILSALVTGYLVFRTKREKYDTLIARSYKADSKPAVVDEFHTAEDEGLPDPIRRINERFNASMAVANLKRAKNA